jgi:beta-lactamase class A
LAALSALPFVQLGGCASLATGPATDARFAALERDLNGRLGVFALDTGSGRTLGYRQDERFAMLSTFKPIAAAAVLSLAAKEPGFLQRRIRYTKADLVTYSPVTEKHLDDGMTLEQLCAAAVIYSDNSAANLLMRETDGPSGVTRFARTIGDTTFRLDRWETSLNSAIEGDPRDTTTPAAMVNTLRKLVLGDALPARGRALLTGWLLACATGAERIRAGVPAGWRVGDKTGTGAFGSANDVGVIWPTSGAPIVLAIFTVQKTTDSKARSDLVAGAARVVAERMQRV